MKQFFLLSALGAVSTLCAVDGVAGEPPAGAVLHVPRTGVGTLQEVTGKLLQPGYPVLLVRADLPEEHWWVQDHAAVSGDGQFAVKARFGNERTRPGTRFRAIVLVLGLQHSRELWQPGDLVSEIPVDIPRSREELVVTRDEDAKARIIDDVLTNMRPDMTVGRIHEITGKLEDHYPIVLVRSAEPNSPWWVQPPVKVDPKTRRFVGQIVLGNDKTPSGARFRVLVLAIERPTDVRKFPEGLRISELSPAIPRSEEATVIYRSKDEIAAAPELN